MALPSVYAVCAIKYQSDDKSGFINVQWMTTGATILPANGQLAASHLAAAMDTVFAPLYKAVISAECAYMGVDCRLNISGVTFDSSANAGQGIGALTGDTLPDYCAAVIRKRTAIAGRSGRGRWYIGCVAEISTNTSVLTPTAQTLYANLAVALKTAVSTAEGSWTPQHHSAKQNAIAPFLDTVINLTLGTQRRRRVR